MSDIVERLKKDEQYKWRKIMREAAAEIESLRAAVNLLAKCYKFVEDDAMMMAAITRHSPLDPESQAKHDSTESLSERLIREIQSNDIATSEIKRLEGKTYEVPKKASRY